MRMIRAVKTGLLVTFIAASGMAVAQDRRRRRPRNFRRRTSWPPRRGAPDRLPLRTVKLARRPSDRRSKSTPRRDNKVGAAGPGALSAEWRRPRYAATRSQYGDPRYAQPAPPPPANVPPQLTIAPGTFLTVRVNQLLSSDHNHAGDAFSASLVKPIVVNGVVVADRGQSHPGPRFGSARKPDAFPALRAWAWNLPTCRWLTAIRFRCILHWSTATGPLPKAATRLASALPRASAQSSAPERQAGMTWERARPSAPAPARLPESSACC